MYRRQRNWFLSWSKNEMIDASVRQLRVVIHFVLPRHDSAFIQLYISVTRTRIDGSWQRVAAILWHWNKHSSLQCRWQYTLDLVLTHIYRESCHLYNRGNSQYSTINENTRDKTLLFDTQISSEEARNTVVAVFHSVQFYFFDNDYQFLSLAYDRHVRCLL